MTTPKSAFDDSQPTFNTVTLPVIIDTEDEGLKNVMERTMNHFGLLYYQAFLKDLEAYWPAELKNLTVTHDGEGFLALGMTERPSKPWQTEYDHDALAVFRRRVAIVLPISTTSWSRASSKASYVLSGRSCLACSK